MKTLAERIKAAEDDLIARKDALVESVAALEANPNDASLLTQVEEMTAEVEQHEKSLSALKKAEAALAARAAPVGGAPAGTVDLTKRADPKGKPGDLFFKHGAASLVSFVTKRPVDVVLDEMYGKEQVVKATFQRINKTAADPALTTATGWAQELVRDEVRGFVQSLADVSIGAALAARALTLDFGGANSVTIPSRNRSSNLPSEPAWVAEGRPIPLTKFSFSSKKINRYKLAAITTFSREIAQRSAPQIENLLREALRESYAEVLDAALLSAAPGIPDVRPPGLLAGVTLIPGTAGGGEDAVRADIMAAVKAMSLARVGARPVLAINNMDRLALSMMTTPLSEYVFRAELAGGNLLGLPVVSSANVPQHTMVLVDTAYLATAFDAPEWDVSDVATVVEVNADGVDPSMAAVGKPGLVGPDDGLMVGGAQVARSLWQTYSLGIRMVAPTSWASMLPGTVQGSTDTTWSA